MLFATQVLGTPDLSDDGAACGMPVSAQMERLRRELAATGRTDVSVVDVDLYSLVGSERDVALDAVVAGKPSPFVLLGGHLVCTGSVEVPTVLAALETSA
jgi:hypothetical protein